MALSTGPLNRLLERERWARERLSAFAGRTFLLRVGPMTSVNRIGPSGLLESAPLSGATPDLTLTLSPFDVAAFLADPRRFDELVSQRGDAALAATLAELAATLPWFVEQSFARAFGSIVGQRMASAGRRLLAFPEYAARRVAANVGGYARDEVRVLAHPADLRTLGEDTAFLDARIDALAARIGAVDARMNSPRG